MKKVKLKQIAGLVEEILREDELAKRDDCYLILEVIRRMYPFEVGKTFANVMLGAQEKGISFEGITRARRSVQRKYPELKDKKVEEVRKKEEEEYREFSRED